ncbi:MAG: transporter, partial [Actinomycetia bacterium]|nr:transporter [Actinomycetes bacterium]
NTFVLTSTLPGPLKVVAEWNQVSAVVQAARELFGNVPPGSPKPAALPPPTSIPRERRAAEAPPTRKCGNYNRPRPAIVTALRNGTAGRRRVGPRHP